MEATLVERVRDLTIVEYARVVEAYKKSGDIVKTEENHCLDNLIKVYSDFVKQIHEVHLEFPEPLS